MATRKLIVYPNKDLMIQAGAQRLSWRYSICSPNDCLMARIARVWMWRCLAVRPRSRWAWC